jgi:hypothetical protein
MMAKNSELTGSLPFFVLEVVGAALVMDNMTNERTNLHKLLDATCRCERSGVSDEKHN